MPIDPTEFNKLKFDVERLTESMTRVETAICGDQRMGIPGIAEDLKELKIWKSNLTKRLAFVSGAFVTIWELGKQALEWLNPHK